MGSDDQRTHSMSIIRKPMLFALCIGPVIVQGGAGGIAARGFHEKLYVRTSGQKHIRFLAAYNRNQLHKPIFVLTLSPLYME